MKGVSKLLSPPALLRYSDTALLPRLPINTPSHTTKQLLPGSGANVFTVCSLRLGTMVWGSSEVVG